MDEKYVKIGTPAMRIVEECGEILQAVGKGERFGWLNHHPNRPWATNLHDLKEELNDLNLAVQSLEKMLLK